MNVPIVQITRIRCEYNNRNRQKLKNKGAVTVTRQSFRLVFHWVPIGILKDIKKMSERVSQEFMAN